MKALSERPADEYAAVDTTNDKWGEAAKAGFQTIPDVLLKQQSRLGLTPTEMIALLNLGWRHPGERLFPRSATIAGRMGVVVRTVQRALATLRRLGLLAKVKETSPEGVDRRVYGLSGLVERLEELTEDDPVRTERREARRAQ